MIHASLIVWPQVYRTKAMQALVSIAEDFGVQFNKILLDGTLPPDKFTKLIMQQKNTIAWTSHGTPYEIQRKNSNILFLENGPLIRKRSIFVDENGFGSASNVVLRRYNVEKYNSVEQDNLLAELEKDGYIIDYKEKDTKVCLIALQGFRDNIILNNCIKFLPKCEKVIVRGHPSKKEKCRSEFDKYCQNLPNWEYDDIESTNDSLARCEALITNNSSLMYRAMLVGIKVATCDQGFHTGSNAVLNCSRDPRMLAKVFEHKTTYEDIMSLLCGIQKSVFFYNDNRQKIFNYTSFTNWLGRLKP